MCCRPRWALQAWVGWRVVGVGEAGILATPGCGRIPSPRSVRRAASPAAGRQGRRRGRQGVCLTGMDGLGGAGWDAGGGWGVGAQGWGSEGRGGWGGEGGWVECRSRWKKERDWVRWRAATSWSSMARSSRRCSCANPLAKSCGGGCVGAGRLAAGRTGSGADALVVSCPPSLRTSSLTFSFWPGPAPGGTQTANIWPLEETLNQWPGGQFGGTTTRWVAWDIANQRTRRTSASDGAARPRNGLPGLLASFGESVSPPRRFLPSAPQVAGE